MQRSIVGGPLLGSTAASADDELGRTMAPVTVTIDDASSAPVRLVLLASPDYVTVLNAHNGQRWGTLVVNEMEGMDDSPANMNGTAVVDRVDDDMETDEIPERATGSSRRKRAARPKTTRRQICSLATCASAPSRVWIGGTDGTLSLFDLHGSTATNTVDCPRHLPQCTYQVAPSTTSVTYLSIVPHEPDAVSVSALLTRGSTVSLVQFTGPVVSSRSESDEPLVVIDAKAVIDWQDQTIPLDSMHCRPHKNPHPFFLHTVVRSREQLRIVLLVSATKMTLYVQDVRSTNDTTKKIVLDQSVWKEPMTVCQWHGDNDFVTGHVSGGMRVWHGLLPAVERYTKSKAAAAATTTVHGDNDVRINPPSLVRSLLMRKVHWHAHAVACLAHDASSGLLFSGGEESVLVTWQLQSSGPSDKAIHTLPRMAVGAMRHLLIVPASLHAPATVLVVCRDSTVQLVECQSKALVWKHQGLASPCTIDHETESNETIAMQLLHGSHHIVAVSGLGEAPGSIHWYNTLTQRVVSHWEIVPFNRVSPTDRRETHETAPRLPTPLVTHAVFAARQTVAITVDSVPTENSCVGAVVTDGPWSSGSVTSIRFWQQTSRMNYDCVAAMSFPHGSRNRVAAVALCDDGTMAATVSNDESALRLWYRRTVRSSNDDPSKSQLGDWTCRCKVSIPSGYANFKATSVSFSPDASVLAVALGPFVTMWDWDSVALLTALRHDDDLVTMQFVPPCVGLSDGMMLLHSKTSVSLQSPYGDRGPNVGWDWKLDHSRGHISRVEFVASEAMVVIAQYDTTADVSRLVLINAVTGLLFRNLKQSPSPVLGSISGSVVALSTANHALKQHCWGHGNDSAVLTLYALTSKGEMVCFTNRVQDRKETADSVIPVVPALPQFDTRPKRKFQVLDVGDLEQAPSGTLSLGQFGGLSGDHGPIPTSQLPLLRGAFVRAFIGRNLMRKDSDQ